jgi:hypothetical protein
LSTSSQQVAEFFCTSCVRLSEECVGFAFGISSRSSSNSVHVTFNAVGSHRKVVVNDYLDILQGEEKVQNLQGSGVVRNVISV